MLVNSRRSVNQFKKYIWNVLTMVAAAHQNLNIEVHSSCVLIFNDCQCRNVCGLKFKCRSLSDEIGCKTERPTTKQMRESVYMHMLSKFDRYIATVRHNNWSKLLSFILIWSTHKKKCHLMLFDVVYTNWNENNYPHRHKCTAHTYRNMKMIFNDGFAYDCVSKPYNN